VYNFITPLYNCIQFAAATDVK